MDVLQDAYIKAFARLDSLQDANAFPGWMSTIVANTAINALQKKKIFDGGTGAYFLVF